MEYSGYQGFGQHTKLVVINGITVKRKPNTKAFHDVKNRDMDTKGRGYQVEHAKQHKHTRK